jgi:predicted GH43/DUF377 family glycosyl hydrolase
MEKITRRSFLYASGMVLSSATMLRETFGASISRPIGHIRSTDYEFNFGPAKAAMSVAAAGNAGGVPSWGLGPFVRDDGADHIGAKADSMFPCPISGKIIPWENKSVLCAGAVVKDNKVFMFYRAEDLSRGNSWGTSRIGLAVSEDGRHFKRHPIPVLYPDREFMRDYEWPGGCQDPRVAETEDGTYVMTYTSYDGKKARLSCATSKDLYHWTKRGLAIGNCHEHKYRDFWSKSGSIVCRRAGSRFIAQRINGKYWMYFNDSGAMVATSDDLTDWDVVENADGNPLVALPRRPDSFDSYVVEPGPPAFLTEDGILLIYNAGAHGRPDLGLSGNVWAVAQALFDPKDPTRLIDRMDADCFHPERNFEIVHQGAVTGGSGNVTFVESLVWFHHEWRFYYGCADSIVASAAYRPRVVTKQQLSRQAEKAR